MSGHRYISHSANLFDDDDIDDETFLKNSSQGRQDYQERTRAVEERTLASSNRSMSLLYETEKVGIATAEELSRQREQLENTNKHLDDINQTLRFSQKHLNGLRSIFGGLKNYIAGQRDEPLPQATSTPIVNTLATPMSSHSRNVQSFPNLHEAKVHSEITSHQSQSTVTGTGGSFNKQLDKNLDEMAGSLSRLKGLAIDMNQEIDSQNDLIDDITTKVENVDSKLGKQNKEINRLLGKK